MKEIQPFIYQNGASGCIKRNRSYLVYNYQYPWYRSYECKYKVMLCLLLLTTVSSKDWEEQQHPIIMDYFFLTR